MSPAPAQYKKCPNCGNDRFYVDNPVDGLVFFHVTLDGGFVSTKDPSQKVHLKDSSEIFCTSCGWHGRMDELRG